MNPQRTYDPDSDERYSPESLRRAEDQRGLDREFDDIAKNYGDSTQHPLGDKEGKSAGALVAAEKRAKDPVGSAGGAAAGGGLGDALGKGFTAAVPAGRAAKALAKVTNFFLGSKKRKASTGIVTALIVFGAIAGGSFFSFLNVFKLDHFLSNIESKAFLRYQVNLEGRTSKWINAYMSLRMMEVAPDGTTTDYTAPRDQDNIMFRSDRVDTNQPLTDWYRTMRASKFEQDLWEKEGIKFVSVAYRDPATGTTRFRPGQIITNKDKPIPIVLSQEAMDILNTGDANKMNGFLSKYVTLNDLDNNKAARKAIKDAVDKEISPWQWNKRRHIRKDIQNMTGVRSWRFFENTRNRIDEKTIDMRNRFIKASLPESTRSGKFVQCLFGIISCKSSPDPAAEANRSPSAEPDGTRSGETGTDGDKEVAVDSEGRARDAIPGDLPEGEAGAVGGRLANSATAKMVSQILSKINAGTSIVYIIDAIARLDKVIGDDSLVNMVTVARGTQALGFFTTLGIARDQMKTGEANSTEINDFMNMANSLGNNEAWTTVVAPSSSADTVYAATENTQSKSDFCSEANLEQATDADFAYQCPEFKIGGPSAAADITDFWKTSAVGQVIGGVLEVYRNTLGPIVTLFNDIGSNIFEFFKLDTLLGSIMSGLGLDKVAENITAWLGGVVAQKLGAGPMISNVTGPLTGLLASEGAAYGAESSLRYQGAALTNAETRASTTADVAAYRADEADSQGFAERYFALDNPTSLASQQLFAVSNSGALSSPQKFLASIFSFVGSIPTKLFSFGSASAATGTDGYALAEFSGVDTYDLPSQCINGDVFDMTPQNATNADDLGIIPANELTWDLVRNKEEFYNRLYQDENVDQNLALQVYNCALFDTAVMGSLGAQYGYEDDNPIGAKTTTSSTDISGSGDMYDKDYLLSSSEDTECAAGTTDVGIQDGYVNKQVVKIRLCAIPGLKSTDKESNSGSGYYVEGANGLGLVNAKASASVLNMVNAMKAAGLDVSATSTFRTNQRQAELYASLGSATAAAPGTSNHQMGYAIDFSVRSGQTIDKCKNVNGVCQPPDDPKGIYAWLTQNAGNYGYNQYIKEFWHWEAAGV